MRGDFIIAGWESQGSMWAAEEAAQELANTYLSPEQSVSFISGVDLVALLGGVDPATMWGPDGKVTSVLYVQGWGVDGAGEAMLIIAEHPDGGYTWNAVLVAAAGFSGGEASGLYATLASFEIALMDAITTHNYDWIRNAMTDPFSIAGWQSDGSPLPFNEALDQLRTTYLPLESNVAFVLGADLATLLDGTDPLTLWGPDVNAASALYSIGWGADGQGEALVIIVELLLDDGTPYWAWHAILYTPGGF